MIVLVCLQARVTFNNLYTFPLQHQNPQDRPPNYIKFRIKYRVQPWFKKVNKLFIHVRLHPLPGLASRKPDFPLNSWFQSNSKVLFVFYNWSILYLIQPHLFRKLLYRNFSTGSRAVFLPGLTNKAEFLVFRERISLGGFEFSIVSTTFPLFVLGFLPTRKGAVLQLICNEKKNLSERLTTLQSKMRVMTGDASPRNVKGQLFTKHCSRMTWALNRIYYCTFMIQTHQRKRNQGRNKFSHFQ